MTDLDIYTYVLFPEFGRKPSDEVPPLLELYLTKIASTGETMWVFKNLEPDIVC